MQIDMHCYGVYALARAAGISDRYARAIAYSSQYVDDAVEDEEIVISDDYAVLPVMSSHEALDIKNAIKGDNWKVWVPFHFLPGNDSRGGDFIHKLICRKNSEVAQKMIGDALDKANSRYWPHLIGVTAHVYADTFAHYGFIGICSDLNRVDNKSVKIHDLETDDILSALKADIMATAGKLAGVVPVGHGTAAVCPDIPFLSWSYRYEKKEMFDGEVNRRNAEDFLEGAEALHAFFSRYAEADENARDNQSKRSWTDIAATVKDVINFQDDSKEKRIAKWQEAIKSGNLFNPTNLDRGFDYNKYMMQLERLKNINASKEDALDSDALKFHRATQHHRYYVLNILLPEFGILI